MAISPDEKVHFQLDQIAAIEEAFYCFDVNNDGFISVKEFKKVLKSLGETATDKEIQARL